MLSLVGEGQTAAEQMQTSAPAEDDVASSAFLPRGAEDEEEEEDKLDIDRHDHARAAGAAEGLDEDEDDIWDAAAIEQLGCERYDVTDPEVFKDVDDAFEAGTTTRRATSDHVTGGGSTDRGKRDAVAINDRPRSKRSLQIAQGTSQSGGLRTLKNHLGKGRSPHHSGRSIASAE
jgi:hypothetical protein